MTTKLPDRIHVYDAGTHGLKVWPTGVSDAQIVPIPGLDHPYLAATPAREAAEELAEALRDLMCDAGTCAEGESEPAFRRFLALERFAYEVLKRTGVGVARTAEPEGGDNAE